jgi:hypothetical protein
MQAKRWSFLMLLLIAVFPLSIGVAQRGRAPLGWYHYPANYHGDTFTGEVVHTDGVRQLTLEYKHGSTSEAFTGTIEAPCMAHLKEDPHQTKELRLSTIRNGTVLTVFYNPVAENGAEAERNTILAIRFDRMNGREFTNPRRPVVPCSKRTGPHPAGSGSHPS